MRTRLGGWRSDAFWPVCNGLRLAGEAPRLAHAPFGLAGKGLEVACEGLDLAHRRWSLALAGMLRSRRGGRWGFRATGETGTHLSLERVQTCTGTDPLKVIGKPETAGMHVIMDQAGATPDDTVVIGDRLDTDILAGNRLGATSVLVLTGIATMADVEAAPPEMKPHIFVEQLPEMLEALGING